MTKLEKLISLFGGQDGERHVLEISLNDLRYWEAEIGQLRAQLPEGMKHCTILFKECERGHGRLTATNWIDNDECPVCTKAELLAALQSIANDDYLPDGIRAVEIARAAIAKVSK